MSEDDGLKRRVKQWKRVSKYLKRVGFAIEPGDGNSFRVVSKKTPECYVFVNITDRCTIVSTPREKVPEDMFEGKTTEWLYWSLCGALAVPFIYDREEDEIYSYVLLEEATDNTLYEAVKLIWRGSFDFLCAVAELSEDCKKE